MAILIVVSNPKDWEFAIDNVQVISNKAYLTDPQYAEMKNAKVFNLSRSYKYQSSGYYVSLLATARNHKVIPSISTIEEMKSTTVSRIISEDLDELIQKSLGDLRGEKFTLSIYFGKNVSKKYNKLSLQLFNLFQVPFLRAYFVQNHGKWQVQNISPITTSEIPEEHKPYVEDFARGYFAGNRFSVPQRQTTGYDLAILVNPNEKTPPSDEKSIQKFVKAAEKLGINAYLITKDDYSRLAEFDALFIRETTAVNHYTFRFAQRAAAEGLAVVDDPESIIRCSNKVYLAELMKAHNILAPKTLLLHKDNKLSAPEALGLPLILKQPDSSFSQGVVKVEDAATYEQEVSRLLEKSELVVAQEYLQSDFDWRVGVMNGEALYVCKYFMANKHWQIINWQKKGRDKYGKVETLPVELAPPALIKTAVKLSNLIGPSLYGVDIKQVGNKFYVIEINDNPNIDSGIEDAVLKDKLYERIMEQFLRKVRQSKTSISF